MRFQAGGVRARARRQRGGAPRGRDEAPGDVHKKALDRAVSPARASIVAAANPKGGQYNRSLNITDNLNMSPALLSRFDLIFILVDDADATLDEHRARHVLAPHGVGGVAQLKQAQDEKGAMQGNLEGSEKRYARATTGLQGLQAVWPASS